MIKKIIELNEEEIKSLMAKQYASNGVCNGVGFCTIHGLRTKEHYLTEDTLKIKKIIIEYEEVEGGGY